MRGPDGKGRVLVLDVGYSSTKYRIYLGGQASRHAYYLRPPEGMNAYDLEKIVKEAGGEEAFGFRFFAYPELHTDLKPILSADPYAGKYFERDDERRYLQIEGERPMAREAIAKLLEGLKQRFDPKEFPRIDEFALQSYKPAAGAGQAEIVLIRRDSDRNELRKSEPGFHVAVAEHGFAREIDIHRPILAETEPVLILNSNESTTESGHAFLADMAGYFGSETYIEQSAVSAKAASEVAAKAAPPDHAHFVTIAPKIEPPKVDERQLLARAAGAISEQLPDMKSLQKRKAFHTGPRIVIAFPGTLGFGKGPSDKEIREVASVYRATKGDPSFGSGWYAHYQIDSKTGELRIEATMDASPPKGWTAL